MNYPEQCRLLLNLCEQLNNKGYKKKDLAAILEIPAPVFSSLLNTILPLIAEIAPQEKRQEEKINYAFSQVNNMSPQKTLDALGDYTLKLEKALNTNLTLTNHLDYLSLIKQQARNSYEYIKQYYEGVYHLYYVSSNHYQIKCEPFLIKANPIEKTIEVLKGNQKSNLFYIGVAMLAGNHTLTIQLAEANESPQEFLMANLSLPFIRKSNYLRGTFNAVSYASQPIARKMVIHKLEKHSEPFDYHAMETVYFAKDEQSDIPEIHQYLLSEPSKIECYSIPNPKFDAGDLIQELKISKQLTS
ncbi:MAG: hypothetical protein N4A74_07300 [Carboxylicivirga sp.]|jgi:hypothetical protein|nr:hypothetical protein [Carboxylicivirga sp.]